MPTENTPGFTEESLLDGQVICFTVVSSTRATVDAFVEEVIRLQTGKSLSSVTYYVFDFSLSFAAFNTPYAKARMTELTAATREYTSYCAIILAPTFLTHIAQFFLKILPQKNSISRLFPDRQSGLDWLEQMIVENSQANRKIL